jgi:hypothetical protein
MTGRTALQRTGPGGALQIKVAGWKTAGTVWCLFRFRPSRGRKAAQGFRPTSQGSIFLKVPNVWK